MVFASLIELLFFFSDCDQEDVDGFERGGYGYCPGIMLLLQPPHCD